MFIGKLAKALFVFCLLLCLSACSDRAEFEQRFAKVGEVYPTENVSDLFEKFPDGFHIRHTRYEYVDGETYFHTMNFDGNSKTKEIKGSYLKHYYDGQHKDITIFDSPVVYTEDNGLQFTSGEPMDPFMTDFQFAFEWFELNQKKLSQLEYRGESENPVSGGYGLYYFIEDNAIYKHFKIKNRNKLALSIHDYKWGKEDKYSVELLVLDMSKDNNVDYFLESVYEK